MPRVTVEVPSDERWLVSDHYPLIVNMDCIPAVTRLGVAGRSIGKEAVWAEAERY